LESSVSYSPSGLDRYARIETLQEFGGRQIGRGVASGLAAATGEHDPLRHFALHNLSDLCVLSDNIAIHDHPRLQNGSA
jgi:hypothetical protein